MIKSLYFAQESTDPSILEFFNMTHIMYIVISTVLMVGILILAKYFVKKQKSKNIVLAVMALTTFFLHISIVWVDYLKYGSASVPNYLLFPIYFCNLNMFLFLILICMKDKESAVFKALATYLGYGAVIGAIVATIYVPDLFGGSIWWWGNFKSLASHTTLLMNGFYLFIGGFVKIRVKNLVPFFGGMIGACLLGAVTNWIYAACGLPTPNAMYLVEPPIPGVPFLNTFVMIVLALILVFAFTAIWEYCTIKDRQSRWYKKSFKDFANFTK